MSRLLALVGLVTLALPSIAGEIRISQTLTAHLEETRLRLDVQVENQGPEAALDVQPVVFFEGRPHPLPSLPKLEAGTFYLQTLELPVPAPGTYGLLVDLRYRSERAAYSLPAHVQVPLVSPPQPLTLRLRQEGDVLLVELANHAEQPVTLHLTALAPRELGLTPLPATLDLSPGAQRSLPLHFTQRDVGHQSNAPLHVVADYLQDGTHHTLHAQMDLHPPMGPAHLPWSLLAGGFALLLALAFIPRRDRRASAS